MGKRLAHKANRAGGADHVPDPRVHQAIAGEVSLIDHYEQGLGDGERSLTRRAKTHDGQTFARLQSVPGSGQMLALVMVSEIQDIARFPRGQDFVSSCRVVKCATASGGKRLGTSGKKIGPVHFRWACAEAAVLFLRHNQPGKAYCTKLARKHGTAKARTVRAHKLGRAVYDLRTRAHAVALNRFVPGSPLRGELEPAASRADNG